MEEVMIWLITAGVVAAIFLTFILIICCYRRRRREQVMSGLIQTRYSVHSRHSIKSFVGIPWRNSVSSSSNSNSIRRDQVEVEACTSNNVSNNNSNNKRFSFFNKNETKRANLPAAGCQNNCTEDKSVATTGLQNNRLSVGLGLVGGRGCRKSEYPLTLDIIREYEEKESALGLKNLSVIEVATTNNPDENRDDAKEYKN